MNSIPPFVLLIITILSSALSSVAFIWAKNMRDDYKGLENEIINNAKETSDLRTRIAVADEWRRGREKLDDERKATEDERHKRRGAEAVQTGLRLANVERIFASCQHCKESTVGIPQLRLHDSEMGS